MSSRRLSLRKLDAAATFVVRLGFFSVWPTLVAIALGATIYGATHPSFLPPMFDNDLSADDRVTALWYFAASLLVVAVVYATVLGYRYRKDWPPGFDRAKALNPYLSFVLSGPFIVALTEAGIEKSHMWRTWLYTALVVLAWWPTLRALSGRSFSVPASWPRLSSRQLDMLSLGFVLALWAGYAYFFTRLAINGHHTFATRTIDLGIYDNIFFQSSHGRPLGCTVLRGETHLSAHFDPILVLLSPLYRLWPRAEFLLTLQSVWCGSGVVAAYLLGRHQLASRAWGLAWALVYALHPALHGANLYEFHSLTLVFAPLLFALYFLLAGKLRLYFATLVVLLLIREDVALLMCFVGLYALISGEPRHKLVGWTTILVSVVYFIVVKTTFMASPDLFNQGNEAYGFSYYYKGMIPNSESGLDFVTTLLTNPAFVVALVAKAAKWQYLLVIFAPTLFLAAWAGRARVMLLYGLIFTLLASRSAVFSTHFQYSAVLLPVVIALAPVGLRRLRDAYPDRKALVPAVMGCVLAATLLVSWKQGAIVENDSFRGGWARVTRTMTPQMEQSYLSFLELIAPIAPEDSVSVSNRVGPHLTNRAKVYRLVQNVETEYIVLDSRDLRGSVKSQISEREKNGNIELVGSDGTRRLYRRASAPKRE
jgi:uncharacterized membrane protein